MAKRLTQIAISKIRPAATRREVPDAGKPGLYLVIQPSGRKSWAVRYRFQGQSRKYTLPGFPSLPLAHRQAQAVLAQVAEGLDPAAEKRMSAAPSSDDLFRNVAANFIQRYVKQHNSKRYGRDVVTMLGKDVLPRWGDRRIQDITKRDVLELSPCGCPATAFLCGAHLPDCSCSPASAAAKSAECAGTSST